MLLFVYTSDMIRSTGWQAIGGMNILSGNSEHSSVATSVIFFTSVTLIGIFGWISKSKAINFLVSIERNWD